VQLLSQSLGIVIGYGTGGKALPDRAGEVVEAGERARAVNRGGHLVAKHRQPFRAASDQASSLPELVVPA